MILFLVVSIKLFMLRAGEKKLKLKWCIKVKNIKMFFKYFYFLKSLFNEVESLNNFDSNEYLHCYLVTLKNMVKTRIIHYFISNFLHIFLFNPLFNL